MASPKTAQFPAQTAELARWAKALSHPARVKIMEILHRLDGCVCGSLVDQLPLSQSTVSQHLSELRDAGLVQGEIDGPRVCYCVNRENWERARAMFSEFFSQGKCC